MIAGYLLPGCQPSPFSMLKRPSSEQQRHLLRRRLHVPMCRAKNPLRELLFSRCHTLRALPLESAGTLPCTPGSWCWQRCRFANLRKPFPEEAVPWATQEQSASSSSRFHLQLLLALCRLPGGPAVKTSGGAQIWGTVEQGVVSQTGIR